MDWTTARVVAAVAAVGAVTVAALPVSTQESTDGDRVIHRYFDAEDGDGDAESGLPEGAGGDGREAGVEGADRPPTPAGAAPGMWMSPAHGEWIWTPEGPTGPGELTQPHGDLGAGAGPTELDGQTDRVDRLDYQSSFEPSVIPFKRGGVQDRVRRGRDGGYSVELGPRSYQEVPVGGELREGQERFWGSFLVRLEPERHFRIPSVAPGQRVLSVETEPEVRVDLRRDQADNFYVVGDADELVRINIELAVDRWYFDGAIDDSVGWEDFEIADWLDDQLLERAETVFETIGVDRNSATPAEVLDRLVEYHRSFESRPVELPPGADRYVEISRRGVGVCRHRAMTFLISARAVGFETRYVYNDAHAFVEVDWPGQGWRRIDLGGAADEIDVQNRGSGAIHDGIWDPEFTRPDQYQEEMARLGGEVDDTDPESGSEESTDPGIDADPDTGDVDAELGEFDEFEPPHFQEEPGRGADVEIQESEGEVYRGSEIEVRGRVEPSEAGQVVEIVLVPVGAADLDAGISLGRTDVEPGGGFQGRWEVPETVSLGRWQLQGRIADR